ADWRLLTLHGANEGRVGRPQSRHQPYENSRENGHTRREPKDSSVEREVDEHGILIGGAPSPQEPAAQPGEDQTKARPQRREEPRFGEQLANDPSPRGTQGRTDRDLF